MTAAKWYSEAAEQGDEDAKEALERLEGSASPSPSESGNDSDSSS